jgi:dienelactone hydrolase
LLCYQVGSHSPRRVIVVFSDVYGLYQGNHKAFCDTIQQHMGEDTTVFCPDLFRGRPLLHNFFGAPDAVNVTLGGSFTLLWGLRTRCSATNVDRDLSQIVEPNVKNTGCEMVGVAGFCFGGWVVGRCLALNQGRSIFAAGVGIHPSFKPEIFAAGGSNPMELAIATQNKPVLWFPAKEDDDLKPTSPFVQAMAKRRAMTPEQISIPFDLPHGFVARGRFMGPEYKEAQEKVIGLTVDFFQQHLKV